MGLLYDSAKASGGDLNELLHTASLLTMANRKLFNAFFQLTPICNLKCKMCYARMDNNEICATGKSILRFEDWKFYIDSIVEMGAMNLMLTGGECTIHPDFAKIYSYAYDKGLNITIMTNGVYLPKEHLELWKQKPPMAISMTVYGASAETYKKLCDNEKAYYSVYENIDKIISAGLNLKPKYTIVQDNLKDLDEVDKFFWERKMMLPCTLELIDFDMCNEHTIKAESVDWEQYSEISQKIYCRRNNTTIEEAKQNSDRFFQEHYSNTIQNFKPLKKGLQCTASRNLCHINWKGEMTPCVALNAFAEDPRETSFKDCWETMQKWADDIIHPTECVNCIFRRNCGYCVAKHYSETGEFGKIAERLCWKKKYPEETAKVEAELIKKGLIKPYAE